MMQTLLKDNSVRRFGWKRCEQEIPEQYSLGIWLVTGVNDGCEEKVFTSHKLKGLLIEQAFQFSSPLAVKPSDDWLLNSFAV